MVFGERRKLEQCKRGLGVGRKHGGDRVELGALTGTTLEGTEN